MSTPAEPTGPTTLPKMLKRPQVEEMTGLGKTAIYDLMALGIFPRPIRISAHAVRWFLHEVLEYIRSRPRTSSRRDRK